MAVPGMGFFAVCHQHENNSFGIWESNDSAKLRVIDNQGL